MPLRRFVRIKFQKAAPIAGFRYLRSRSRFTTRFRKQAVLHAERGCIVNIGDLT